MKRWEVVIVSKEYRTVEVAADNESEAMDRAWELVADGITTHKDAEDFDTDIYVESEITEETRA